MVFIISAHANGVLAPGSVHARPSAQTLIYYCIISPRCYNKGCGHDRHYLAPGAQTAPIVTLNHAAGAGLGNFVHTGPVAQNCL